MLAVRSKQPLPEDPLETLRDYFGQYRDPMWDVMDALKNDNAIMSENLPALEQRIQELEVEVADARREN